MTETILEQSERLDGATVQTVRRDDGTEYQRTLYFTCSICGAHSDRPFPKSAIGCSRPECKD